MARISRPSGAALPMMTHSTFLRGAAALLLLASGSFVAAQSGAPLPADLDPDSRARLPFLRQSDFDAANQKTYEVLPGRGKDGVLRGPLAFAAYNPGAAKALFDLHNAAVAGSLDARTRELAIMVACRETNYSLEWNAHQGLALKVGVEPAVLEVVRTSAPLTGLSEKDAAVVRFGRQMFRDKKMEPATFARVVELYGRKGAMDMVAVMNTYAVSGFYAIAVDERAPEGRLDLLSSPVR
jgi:4-carboxymuconolactone decarboxylase